MPAIKAKGVSRARAASVMAEVNSIMGSPVLRLGNDPYYEVVRIPTGSYTMDRVTGGGWALGRHVELFGDESVCKSYLCYRTMAMSQGRGKLCAVIDAEHTFDYDWFEHLGGKPEELLTAQPKTAEAGISAMMILLDRGDVEVITVDSIASLSTKQEASRDPEQSVVVASQARFMSQNLRRLTTVNEKTAVLWTNQKRSRIGVFFGNPDTTSGGRAMRYYATMRFELRKGEAVKVKKKVAKKGKLVPTDVTVGNWVMVKNLKNKSSIPYAEGSFIFDNREGRINEASELIQLGLEDELITASGSGPKQTKYKYVDYDEQLWEGNLAQFGKHLAKNPDLKQELAELIQEQTLELAVPAYDKEEEFIDDDELEDDDDDE